MQPWLKEKLDALPAAPGVYLMKDREGAILYVGKAVNLRSRVRSYFARSSSDTRAFISLLDDLLGDLEIFVVRNEKEALILENELVKRHKPRFNVRLRDDSNFICLRLDVRADYPRLEVVRRIVKDGAHYFGPYSSASSIRETLRIINRYFQLRTCTDHALRSRKRPCLLYQIDRCPAPCVYDVPREDYHRNVRDAELFLEGKAGELIDGLKDRMQEAVAALRFEDAARLRDQLRAIEKSLERQKVATSDLSDQDAIGAYREADRLLVYVLHVRNGRISGHQSFWFTGQEFPDAELIGSFVNLYYDQEAYVPERVLLPLEIEEIASLSAVLSERRGRKVYVQVPQRGEKLALVQLAEKNAQQAFSDRRRTKEELEHILERLQKKLNLTNLPRTMECFDISHFQGSAIVASQVASVDGEADKSRYRRYHLKDVTSNDDFASMYEILRRRFERGRDKGDLPDLIVIDGGRGQLASALAAMRDVGVEGVDVVGLAKSRDLEVADRDEERVKSPERVFLPNRKDPIVLPQTSPELFMLTRLRDEAHRFAITFQQRVLRRRGFHSSLDGIPGVGEGRQKALLRHFGSMAGVKAAGVEQLSEVPGIGPSIAERIHAFLHGGGGEEVREDAVREASLEDAGVPSDEN